MGTDALHLTEFILCLHNEVQSAVDYIAAQAAEPSELGQSSASMAVQTLRVRLPFETEVVRARARAPATAAPEPLSASALRAALARRKGLALDIGKPGGMATYLKLQVRPGQGGTTPADPAAATARAEIEITFVPLQRPAA